MFLYYNYTCSTSFWSAVKAPGPLMETDRFLYTLQKSPTFKAYQTESGRYGTLQRKSHLCIPRKESRSLSPNFHIHVSVSDLYISRIGPHIFLQQIRQTVFGMYKSLRSQTHECGNWDWCRAIPFLWIFVSNFFYCVFAVQEKSTMALNMLKMG